VTWKRLLKEGHGIKVAKANMRTHIELKSTEINVSEIVSRAVLYYKRENSLSLDEVAKMLKDIKFQKQF
jgi:hypothetical protein